MAEHDDPVRFLAYGRLSDGLVLASHKSRRAPGACEETCGKVLESGNLKQNAQLTVTVTPEIGTLHLNAGSNDVIAVVTSHLYPRKNAFKLLDEIRAQVSQASIAPLDVDAAHTKNCFAKQLPFMKEAVIRYAEMGSSGNENAGGGNSKIAQVHGQVQEVQTMMEGNINRMLDNAETVGAVEDKSEALRHRYVCQAFPNPDTVCPYSYQKGALPLP